MLKVVSVDQAKLSKVSVEIQVVRVGGRQMTLAVFRQLKREPLIDWKTLQLRGVPWGWVNYHRGCSDDVEHLHIVWQDGNRLLRDDIYPHHISHNPCWEENQRRAVEALADAVVVRILRFGLNDEDSFWQEVIKNLKQAEVAKCPVGGINIRISTSNSNILREAVYFLWNGSDKERANAEDLLRQKYGDIPEFQKLWEEAQAAAAEVKKVSKKWNEVYSALKNLPQLFIAV